MIVIFTIGHSTRQLNDFLDLLGRDEIRHVADVRAFPSSRRHPHFTRAPLAEALAVRGIEYSHHPGLGGRRQALADSPNGAWRNASFRGYADHMQTDEFASALDEVVQLALNTPTAIMCAEAVPWRCHRSLISDALVARGVDVRHLLDDRTTRHSLTEFAQVLDQRVTYPKGTRLIAEQSDIFGG